MKLVRNATWTDMRGVVHIAAWHKAEKRPHGYHLACSGEFVHNIHVDESPAHPTCVRCVVGE